MKAALILIPLLRERDFEPCSLLLEKKGWG